MLSTDCIEVCRGKIQILREVSLSVESGEIVGIIGGNGAGKTTLIKTISGHLRPIKGGIHFLGTAIEKLASHKIVELGLVQVPEGRKLFGPMTVKENLEMGSYLIRSESCDWKIDRVFNLFPILSERKEQVAGSLSGGEQQMLAIARGLMSNPKLIMLDEPSLGLAPIMVKELFKIITRINEGGITVLLVEQNVRQSLSIVGRAYVLENGTITISGKGEDLLQDDRVRRAYLGM